MVQSRGGLRFPLESAESLVVSGNLFRQEFEGNKTVQPGVLGLVHHSHTTAAKLLDDTVMRDGLADHWRESYVDEEGQVNESRAVVDALKE